MRTYTFEVFRKSEQSFDLRFFGPDGRLKGTRPLDRAEIERFAHEVERDYDSSLLALDRLGARLYEWLDGQNRWLEEALGESQDLMILIDVSERLRHLPWELLHRGGSFLCADPNRSFTPVLHFKGPPKSLQCDNRPLRVLFMASSPEGVEPKLDFEDEERKILEATREPSIQLLVEESGSLAGLKERLAFHGAGYFDVVHLSGHAHIRQDGQPCFVMEDELGFKVEATAEQLAQAFSGHFPKLLFLSACGTGQASGSGELPSLCERLVSVGAPAVLGWSLKVMDTSASVAAAKLYEELAVGHSVAEAVARTRQALFKARSPFWHMLRLYSGKIQGAGLLLAHVTEPGRPDRDQIHWRQAEQEFLDAHPTREVCPRELFVGRRRLIQHGLKTLRRQDPGHAEGVLLQGIGGLGKTSLAARLCERMVGYERLVWVGSLDETEFLRVLSDRLDSVEANTLLNDTRLGLKQRLRRLLKEILPKKSFLIVFDDFEDNLELRSGDLHQLKAPAYGVLEALLAALRDTASRSRVIVTSRYEFSVPGPTKLELLRLDSLREADLEKKTKRLKALAPFSSTPEHLRERAKELSAGNPRLLERLDRVLQEPSLDAAALLNELSTKAEEYREELLLRTLLAQLLNDGLWLLSCLTVYEVPVERSGLEAAAGWTPLEPHLKKAVSLGLVECGKTPDGAERFYVSGLVRPLLPKLTSNEQREAANRASIHLYKKFWNDNGTRILAWGREIHRLALLAGAQDIAVDVGDAIAIHNYSLSRYRESAELCLATLKLGEDYRILCSLARAEKILGETKKAREHYEKALADCPNDVANTDPAGKTERAAILYNLADLDAQQGNISKAMDLWQQSLQLLEQIGHLKGQSATLHNMAGVIAQQGDIPKAMELWQQSLQIDEQSGDAQGTAATLNAMAGVIAQQGDISKAMNLWQQVLPLYEQVGDAQGMAATLHNMAGVIARQGDIPKAMDLWQQSLQITNQIGNIQGKAATLHNMAGVIARQGDIPKAMDLWQQSLQIAEQVDDAQGKAATLSSMAGVIARQGDIPKAMDLWQQSLQIIEQVGDVQGKAATLSSMAGVIARQGDVLKAMDLWQQSLPLYEQVGNVEGKATTLSNMAGVIAQQGDIPKAMDLWRQSLPLHEQVGDVEGKAATLTNMAGVIAQQGDISKAMDLWRQSLPLHEQVGNVEGKAATLRHMAWAAETSGNSQLARDLNLEAERILLAVRA